MLSAPMEITYSVQVVRRFLFAERRNFPFSTSKAAILQAQNHYSRLQTNNSPTKRFYQKHADHLKECALLILPVASYHILECVC